MLGRAAPVGRPEARRSGQGGRRRCACRHGADRLRAASRDGTFGRRTGARPDRPRLAQDTPLILADEPTAGLDPGHQIGTLQRFEDLAREWQIGARLAPRSWTGCAPLHAACPDGSGPPRRRWPPTRSCRLSVWPMSSASAHTCRVARTGWCSSRSRSSHDRGHARRPWLTARCLRPLRMLSWAPHSTRFHHHRPHHLA
jgi:hypothetical protein